MRRLLNLFTVFVIVLSFAGCTKAYDYLAHHPKQDFKLCNIVKFNYTSRTFDRTDSALVTYNSLGNPVLINRGDEGPGEGDFYFYYDKRNRLKKIVGRHDDGTEVWTHNYYYKNGKIVIDSFFLAVTYDWYNSPDNFVVAFTYDQKGRITQTIEDGLKKGIVIRHSIRSYEYDQNNNLSKEVSSVTGIDPPSEGVAVYDSYDSNLNYNQTNNIWQFLSRDYSINNRHIANTYNNFGLPQHFPSVYGDQTDLLFGDFWGFPGINNIRYSCDEYQPPVQF